MDNCLFCKIARGEIPSNRLYEDDDIMAFYDIHPLRPVHFLLIPKKHLTSLAHSTDDDAAVLGRMMALAGRLAVEAGSPDGFRLIVNTGRIGQQEVQHLHMHVLGGPEPLGPMLRRVSDH